MLLLGEGSEATEPYNKYDKIRPHSIRSLQFDQKVRPLSFRPEKFDLFTATPLKNDNTLDLVIGPQKFEICLVSVSTSDHNWLNFDCLKHLLENRERSVVKFRNWKNVNLVDSNEDCFYHLWSIEGFPLMEFLGNPSINKWRTCSRNGKSYFETRLPFLR